MRRISEDTIQNVIERVDILSIARAYLEVKQVGRYYFACCPFHHENTPSFSIHTEKRYYHCFGCGAHGSVINFIMHVRQLDFRKAVIELAGSVGILCEDEEVMQTQNIHLYKILAKAVEYYCSVFARAPIAEQFLKDRGILIETAQRFHLGFAPSSISSLSRVFSDYSSVELETVGLIINRDGRRYDRFRQRIIFPIVDIQSRYIGLGGRSINSTTQQPKYFNSPESPLFHKGKIVYGWPQAYEAMSRVRSVCVVEGYMDVLSLSQAGFHNVVATLGTACTEDQIKILFSDIDHIYFCFDSDQAGQRAAQRVLTICLSYLTEIKRVSFIILPSETKDPDDYIRTYGIDQFYKLYNEAKPSWEIFAGLLGTQHPNSSLKKLIAAARKHLVKLQEEPIRERFIEQLMYLASDNENIVRSAASSFRKAENSFARNAISRANYRVSLSVQSTRTMHSIEKKIAALLAIKPERACDISIGIVLESNVDGAALVTLVQALIHQVHGKNVSPLLGHPWEAWFYDIQTQGIEKKLSNDEWEAEFHGALLCLKRQYLEHRCRTLEKMTVLSEVDQDELRHLLQDLQKLKGSFGSLVEQDLCE